jgi:hypothetical protein
MGPSLKQVRFKPWKGKSYGYHSPFGIPVMILGESHYGAKGASSSFTKDVIKALVRGEGKKRDIAFSET